MEALLLWLGRGAAVLGLLICVWAGVTRFRGSFFAGGFQIGTLLLGGMALMLVACVCFLWAITTRPRA